MSEWSVRRIHALQSMTAAARYLEIGVSGGNTFLNVNLLAKDAVDPAFRFDTDQFETEVVRFFPMTSDQFFSSNRSLPQYDIIFLDGLHTFEQTYRDFLATLPLSHERTVWLIDDTLPCDPYSALPDHDYSLMQRGKAGLPGNPWHGDVYKVVCAIHDFCPTLNFATIVDRGNPQTLVWKQARTAFRPVFSGLDAICRLAYLDLDRHADAMRFTTEEAAMGEVARAMGIDPATSESPVF